MIYIFIYPLYTYILQTSLPCHGIGACATQRIYEPCQAGPLNAKGFAIPPALFFYVSHNAMRSILMNQHLTPLY